MGPTLRVEPIGALVSWGVREARPVNAIEVRYAKNVLIARAQLCFFAAIASLDSRGR
jgi:hypothetical protein